MCAGRKHASRQDGGAQRPILQSCMGLDAVRLKNKISSSRNVAVCTGRWCHVKNSWRHLGAHPKLGGKKRKWSRLTFSKWCLDSFIYKLLITQMVLNYRRRCFLGQLVLWKVENAVSPTLHDLSHEIVNSTCTHVFLWTIPLLYWACFLKRSTVSILPSQVCATLYFHSQFTFAVTHSDCKYGTHIVLGISVCNTAPFKCLGWNVPYANQRRMFFPDPTLDMQDPYKSTTSRVKILVQICSLWMLQLNCLMAVVMPCRRKAILSYLFGYREMYHHGMTTKNAIEQMSETSYQIQGSKLN